MRPIPANQSGWRQDLSARAWRFASREAAPPSLAAEGGAGTTVAALVADACARLARRAFSLAAASLLCVIFCRAMPSALMNVVHRARPTPAKYAPTAMMVRREVDE
jgi:hypothetical protein